MAEESKVAKWWNTPVDWLEKFCAPERPFDYVKRPFIYEHNGVKCAGSTNGVIMILLQGCKTAFPSLKNISPIARFIDKLAYSHVETAKFEDLVEFCGEPSKPINCTECGGTGTIGCPNCDGRGRLLEECEKCGDLHLCAKCHCEDGTLECHCDNGKHVPARYGKIFDFVFNINKLAEVFQHLRGESVVMMWSTHNNTLCIDGPDWRVHLCSMQKPGNNVDHIWREPKTRKARSLDLGERSLTTS